MKRRVFEKQVLLSPATNNDFSISGKFADTPFEVEYENFIMGAKEYIKPNPNMELFCMLKGCFHLNNLNWKIVEL